MLKNKNFDVLESIIGENYYRQYINFHVFNKNKQETKLNY